MELNYELCTVEVEFGVKISFHVDLMQVNFSCASLNLPLNLTV